MPRRPDGSLDTGSGSGPVEAASRTSPTRGSSRSGSAQRRPRPAAWRCLERRCQRHRHRRRNLPRGRAMHQARPHWAWQTADGDAPDFESRVKVTFHEDGSETVVHLRHHDLPPDLLDGHREGWHHYLARLPPPPRAATRTGLPRHRCDHHDPRAKRSQRRPSALRRVDRPGVQDAGLSRRDADSSPAPAPRDQAVTAAESRPGRE